MLSIILFLIIIGVILYFVETYIPMSPPIKTVIRIVVVIALLFWLVGLLGYSDIPFPRR